jgi:hypothetical protein
MPRTIQHASRFLRERGSVSAILEVIERQQRLLQAVRKLLPEPLDAHCLYASLVGFKLTLTTDSPVWSTRLRFFLPHLEGPLAKQFGRIKTWQVRVQPSRGLHGQQQLSPATPAPAVSAQTVSHLMEAADSVDDPMLAEALRRLARAAARRKTRSTKPR